MQHINWTNQASQLTLKLKTIIKNIIILIKDSFAYVTYNYDKRYIRNIYFNYQNRLYLRRKLKNNLIELATN